jgi:soluble lytic murein transglycosylase-like protein
MKCLTIVLGLLILTLINPLGNQYVQVKHTKTATKNNRIALVDDVLLPTAQVGTKAITPAPAPPKPANPTPVAVPAVQAPAPVVAPVTPPPAPTYPTSCAAYLPLVEQYNWPVSTMMAIMQAESSCNPYAYNPSGCWGLFQLFGENITDPAANVAAAYQIYLRQGLGAWQSWSSGAYYKFL